MHARLGILSSGGLGTAVLAATLAACGARTTLDVEPFGPTADAGAGGSVGGAGGQGAEGGALPGGGGQGGGGRGGEGGAPPPNPVISLSDDSLLEAETHVVVRANGTVAAAWIATDGDGLPFIATSFSTDGGASWLPPAPMPSPNGGVGADPVLAVDQDDNVYLTWVGYFYGTSEPYDMHIYVARAVAGATTFAATVEVTDPLDGFLYDKPWIAVTAQDTVLVSYLEEPEADDPRLVVARSTDGAETFARTVLDSSYGNLAYLCPSPADERVWLTYISFDSWPVRAMLRRSDDDGASWPSSAARSMSTESDVGYTDPSCASLGDDVWVLYGLTDEPLAGETTPLLYQMRLAHSADGGASLTEAFDAQEPDAYRYALLPAMTLEPDAIHLTFYTGEQEGDWNGAFRRRRAWLGGSSPSFEPSALIERPVMMTGQRASVQWLGDYTGLAVRDGRMYAAFPVNTSGYSHVAFFRTSL